MASELRSVSLVNSVSLSAFRYLEVVATVKIWMTASILFGMPYVHRTD